MDPPAVPATAPAPQPVEVVEEQAYVTILSALRIQPTDARKIEDQIFAVNQPKPRRYVLTRVTSRPGAKNE